MLNIDSVLLSDSVCYRRLVITLAVSELLNYASLLEFTLELLECFFYVFTLFNWYYNHDLLIILVLLLILILDFRGAKICNLFYSTKFSVPFTKNNPPFLLFYVAYIFSRRATACAAMPSSRPTKPKRSVVVAFTLTFSISVSITSASFACICSMYGLSFGL